MEVKVHNYAVDYDSSLGVLIDSYIKRCKVADQSANEFVKNRFPFFGLSCINDLTEVVSSDDCDAGGVLGISVSPSVADNMFSDPRVAVLWDRIEDNIHVGNVIIFPRCERHTHHIRLGKAVSLAEQGATDWDFNMIPSKKSKQMRVRSYLFSEVRRLISVDDLKALSENGDPAPDTKLAIGRQLVLNTDSMTDIQRSFIDRYKEEAFQLYREINDLPLVPANTLPRILGLDTHAQGDFRTQCFCSWHTDDDNHQYIIRTGLISTLQDMKEIETD